MKLRGLLTLAMAAQVVVTAVALIASYAVASGFGIVQLVALLASAAVAVLLARLCARTIEVSQDKRIAVQLAEQVQACADSAQMTQAVIKTALDAFVQTDETGIVRHPERHPLRSKPAAPERRRDPDRSVEHGAPPRQPNHDQQLRQGRDAK